MQIKKFYIAPQVLCDTYVELDKTLLSGSVDATTPGLAEEEGIIINY